jgi:hypothetical protein
MRSADIPKTRLLSQQIEVGEFIAAKELVRWMGAIQAQDYPMAKWAIGLRLAHATDQAVETALNNGEIIRTHVLRPTWHFVSAEDIYWMLECTAPYIKASLKSRHRQLRLSDAIFTKSNAIIETALSGGKHLTRKELVAGLEKGKIELGENRVSHLLLGAEVDGIICSGKTVGKEPTYALLEDRVPRTTRLDQEEALARLAGKYFSSRGPATLKDFIWWSGLPVGQAKLALELAGPELSSETIDSQVYWFTERHSAQKMNQKMVHLLPAYDEFLISYENRRVSLPFTDQKRTISSNGIFRPIIVVDGQVMGIWKKRMEKDRVVIETTFFETPDPTTNFLVVEAASRYGDFLGKEIVIISG